MSIVIPEIVFLQTLKDVLKIIRDDFANQTDETKTILYRVIGQSGALERYDFYTQLKKILITEQDDPREFDISIFFNMNRSTTPHLHITLPNESAGQNGLGIDEGNIDPVFDPYDNAYRKIFTRRFDSTYNFTITSDNSNEVVVLYHFIRAIFIILIDHFEQSNLEHIRIAGGDLNLNMQTMPKVFLRNLSLSFSYDVNVQELFDSEYLSTFTFHQVPQIMPDVVVKIDDLEIDSNLDNRVTNFQTFCSINNDGSHDLTFNLNLSGVDYAEAWIEFYNTNTGVWGNSYKQVGDYAGVINGLNTFAIFDQNTFKLYYGLFRLNIDNIYISNNYTFDASLDCPIP